MKCLPRLRSSQKENRCFVPCGKSICSEDRHGHSIMLSTQLLCFRQRHCESFLVKHFDSLVVLVHLTIFLFGLFLSYQFDDIFWSNFNCLNVSSFSQPNCLRRDSRHIICSLVIHQISSWCAPNHEACVGFDNQNLLTLKPVCKTLSFNFVKMTINPQTINGIRTNLGDYRVSSFYKLKQVERF